MNPEIKRLLKLSSIPGFKLSKKEQAKLDEWKNMQEAIIIKPAKKTRPKTVKKDSEDVQKPVEKVQNVITPKDLTLNSES